MAIVTDCPEVQHSSKQVPLGLGDSSSSDLSWEFCDIDLNYIINIDIAKKKQYEGLIGKSYLYSINQVF